MSQPESRGEEVAKRLAAASLLARRDACTRFLNGHGRQSAADYLALIPADVDMDRYGQGGVVAQLEQELAALLGKEAALFLPSGTMAQQATLRVHADRRGRRGVVFHPYCHLDWHEERGYERLHGLHGIPAGRLEAPLSLESLERVAERPAALLLELPQRNLGGTLPTWPELTAQVAWARSRGAAVHLDGARLWEALPFYGRSAAEVAALFDTVYVSFYKGLGGIAGSAVAGSAEVVAEVAQWRTRHGGRLVALWPLAAAAGGGRAHGARAPPAADAVLLGTRPSGGGGAGGPRGRRGAAVGSRVPDDAPGGARHRRGVGGARRGPRGARGGVDFCPAVCE